MIGKRHTPRVLKLWDSMLSGLFFFKKSVHVGIHVKSEDYGISHTCYPYTPILIRLPPKFQPYPTSRADIVELRNCFAVES